MQANIFLKRKANQEKKNDLLESSIVATIVSTKDIPLAPVEIFLKKQDIPKIKDATTNEDCIEDFVLQCATDSFATEAIEQNAPLFQIDVLKKLYSHITSTDIPKKPLLLIGPSGTGKTACLEYIAKQVKREITTFYGDEEETVDLFLNTSGLERTKRLYVFDSIETYETTDLSKHFDLLLKKRAILVSTDAYDCSIRNKCHILRMNILTPRQIADILQKTYPEIPEASLIFVASSCKQDIRYAFNMLAYATSTAKAKKEHHKRIITEQDLRYDLFGTTYNVLAQGKPISGIQSADLFMFSSMLQSNSYQWSKQVHKGLDSFCMYDIMENKHHFSVDDLNSYLDTTVKAQNNFKKEQQLQMPSHLSIKKKFGLLSASENIHDNIQTADVLTMHDKLNVLRVYAPDRISKGSLYYHENQDVRNYRKNSPFK